MATVHNNPAGDHTGVKFLDHCVKQAMAKFNEQITS
jgi:hypothetical protein